MFTSCLIFYFLFCVYILFHFSVWFVFLWGKKNLSCVPNDIIIRYVVRFLSTRALCSKGRRSVPFGRQRQSLIRGSTLRVFWGRGSSSLLSLLPSYVNPTAHQKSFANITRRAALQIHVIIWKATLISGRVPVVSYPPPCTALMWRLNQEGMKTCLLTVRGRKHFCLFVVFLIRFSLSVCCVCVSIFMVGNETEVEENIVDLYDWNETLTSYNTTGFLCYIKLGDTQCNSELLYQAVWYTV